MGSFRRNRKMYKVVKKGCSIGINHYETAATYGPAEIYLGNTIQNSYFVGNFKASQCTNDPNCTPCGPAEPNNWCSTDGNNCCEAAAAGRLVRFKLPDAAGIATWRTEHVFEGETIHGLSSGRDGSLWIGTIEGNLYQWDPITKQKNLLHTFAGPVLSITQERPTGDWYIEARDNPKIKLP